MKQQRNEKCSHETTIREDRPYTTCVAGTRCNPASHGAITVCVTCHDCGATKKININQHHVEESCWEHPAENTGKAEREAGMRRMYAAAVR